MNPVQAMKERSVDAHLADGQKAADQLRIPVENILAVVGFGGRDGARTALQAKATTISASITRVPTKPGLEYFDYDSNSQEMGWTRRLLPFHARQQNATNVATAALSPRGERAAKSWGEAGRALPGAG
jgi:hypothetical protein